MKKPLSHRHDPQSSYLAADWLSESGRHATQQAEVRWLLRVYPGHTYRELFDKTGVFQDPPSLMRRLSEVGERRDTRKCRVSGRVASTWYLPEKSS